MITTKDYRHSAWPEHYYQKLALDSLKNKFFTEMSDKITKKLIEGERGWDNPEIKEALKKSLLHHIEKGDMVDVANIAMFIWNIEH